MKTLEFLHSIHHYLRAHKSIKKQHKVYSKKKLSENFDNKIKFPIV